VLIFLEDIVPRETRRAQEKLGQIDEIHRIMGLEDRMRSRQQTGIRGRDPATIAKEWHRVAERYQSMLGGGNDSDCPQEKSCVIKLLQGFCLIIPLQMLPDSATCKANFAFDHLDQQSIYRFVYLYDSPLYSNNPETLEVARPVKI
jgi:hypothetical protein